MKYVKSELYHPIKWCEKYATQNQRKIDRIDLSKCECI